MRDTQKTMTISATSFRGCNRFSPLLIWFFCLRSSHAVYDVSKNKTHHEPHSLESDAVRPGREISPLDRWALKEKSTRGDADLECEEEPKGKCGAWWHEPNANPWMHCMGDHASRFCPWMVVQTAILMGLG